MRTTRESRRGSLLILSVIVVVVVMGLAGSHLVVSDVVTQRVFEAEELARAALAAESGIDHGRVCLLALADPGRLDPAAAWDLALRSNEGFLAAATNVAIPDGSYTVRVLDNDDGDQNWYDDRDQVLFLESTGCSTRAGGGGATHVIRCMVALEQHDPTSEYAIITGDDLYIFGAQNTDGSLGRVHSNMDLTVQGNTSIAQEGTASAATATTGMGFEIAGGLAANQPLVPIEPVAPSLYRPYARRILTADGRVLDGATGLAVFAFGALQQSQNSFEGFTWSSAGGWSTVSSGWIDGTYYVEGDISFAHGGTETVPWRVTLVAEGSIQLTGSPNLQPYFHDAELLVAGEDVYARGSGTSIRLGGLILAHEQVNLSGNVTFQGRIVAESALNTVGSAVDNPNAPLLSTVGGGVSIIYNKRLFRSFLIDIRLPIKSWGQDLPENRAPVPASPTPLPVLAIAQEGTVPR